MSLDRLRFRDTQFDSGVTGQAWTLRYGEPVTSPELWPVSIVGRQTTRSLDNPEWGRRKRLLRNYSDNQYSWMSGAEKAKRADRIRYRDIGGPFTTVRQIYGDTDGSSNTRLLSLSQPYIGGTTYRYEGPLMAVSGRVGPTSSYWPSYSEIDLHEEMVSKGTTAIAETVPTNPAVGVAQVIGELKDRLPALPGAALLGRPGNVSKKFADEYLNVEFGLKPLISDIQGMHESVKKSNQLLHELERNSGRLVRRRYSFPEERNISVLSPAGAVRQPWPPLKVQFYNGASQGPYVHRRETVKRIWFSGAYTYHYRQGHDLWDKLMRAEQEGNRLFGLRLTPSLAWELTPWSWAADWVSNAGDVVSNLSAFTRDGLVLRWGYVMCDLRITDTHTVSTRLNQGGSKTLTQSFTTHVKKRIVATPYGFGLDPDWKDFSSRQLAILAALGISRGA